MMIDLGHKYGESMPEKTSEEEPRVYYPEIHLSGDDIPKMGDEPFYAVVKVRKVGTRNPSDGEKSCDVEVMEMSGPINSQKAMDLSAETEEPEMEVEVEISGDKALQAFRSSMEEVLKKSQIGQSS